MRLMHLLPLGHIGHLDGHLVLLFFGLSLRVFVGCFLRDSDGSGGGGTLATSAGVAVYCQGGRWS